MENKIIPTNEVAKRLDIGIFEVSAARPGTAADNLRGCITNHPCKKNLTKNGQGFSYFVENLIRSRNPLEDGERSKV